VKNQANLTGKFKEKFDLPTYGHLLKTFTFFSIFVETFPQKGRLSSESPAKRKNREQKQNKQREINGKGKLCRIWSIFFVSKIISKVLLCEHA